MVQKTFSINQISKKIDDIENLLTDRKLKISSTTFDLDTMSEMDEMVKEVDRKLGRLRTEFNHSATTVLDEKRNEFLAKSVMTLSSDDLIKLSNKLRKHDEKPIVSDDSASYDNPA